MELLTFRLNSIVRVWFGKMGESSSSYKIVVLVLRHPGFVIIRTMIIIVVFDSWFVDNQIIIHISCTIDTE